jgi:hypothetical protein
MPIDITTSSDIPNSRNKSFAGRKKTSEKCAQYKIFKVQFPSSNIDITAYNTNSHHFGYKLIFIFPFAAQQQQQPKKSTMKV